MTSKKGPRGKPEGGIAGFTILYIALIRVTQQTGDNTASGFPTVAGKKPGWQKECLKLIDSSDEHPHERDGRKRGKRVKKNVRRDKKRPARVGREPLPISDLELEMPKVLSFHP